MSTYDVLYMDDEYYIIRRDYMDGEYYYVLDGGQFKDVSDATEFANMKNNRE